MNYNNDKLIAAAFVKARAEIGGTVGKDGQGVYGKYATLAAITDVTSLALSKQGLAIIQEAHLEDGGVTIETTLLHESGATMQFASLTMPLADRKPQAVGSAITYGRRYALAAVCGLAPDDDDGEAAQHAAQPRKVQSSTPTPQKAATPQKSTSEGDVLFSLRAEILDQFNALGEDLYGAQWEQVRRRNVSRISGGQTQDYGELTTEQVEKLVDGMLKLRSQRQAEQVPA